MGSSDRFYHLKFRDRDVLHGDISSLLKIDGLVVGGGGAQAILLLPSCLGILEQAPTIKMSVEAWSEYIQRADNPEIMMPGKVFVRKARFEISGAVQQKIWAADGFKCMVCHRTMGKVQLTVDHWIPLELGGPNDQSNYLSMCRKCNKNKANTHPTKLYEAHFVARIELHLRSRVLE